MKTTLYHRTIWVRIAAGFCLVGLCCHIAWSWDNTGWIRTGLSPLSNIISGYGVVAGSNNTSYPSCGLIVGQNNYLSSAALHSATIGSYNTVYGSGSLGVGYLNTISGTNAAAFGSGNTIGAGAPYSFAAGGMHVVTEDYSAAFGYENNVTAQYAVAAGGSEGHVNGFSSIALAGAANTTATTAEYSIVGGYTSTVNGRAAMAVGNFVTANTYGSAVFGQWNLPLSNETDTNAKTVWRDGPALPITSEPNDPLFVIGNGTGNTARSNAVVVQKDGTVYLQKVPPRGGIDMDQ
ncbi:MAG: hypothetical protein ACR2OZ_11990 [Verrucomicrobiales bacterium]